LKKLICVCYHCFEKEYNGAFSLCAEISYHSSGNK